MALATTLHVPITRPAIVTPSLRSLPWVPLLFRWSALEWGENIQNSHPVYTNCNEWPTRMIYFHHHEYSPTPFTLPSHTHTHMHTPPIVLPVPSASAAAPSASSGRTPCMWHSKTQLSPHSRPSLRALGRDIGSVPAGRLAVHILGAMAPEGLSLGTGYRKADHGSCIRGRCSPDDPE